MRVGRALIVLSRLVLIAWANVWITGLPLFHTHLPSIFQQPVGIPHTVFSRDLPGEYSVFNHKTTPDESDLSGLASNSPELGFVALSEEDDKHKSWEDGDSVPAVPLVLPVLFRSQRVPQAAVVDWNSRWLPSSHGLRAPPVSS